jgi:hypothetical protein
MSVVRSIFKARSKPGAIRIEGQSSRARHPLSLSRPMAEGEYLLTLRSNHTWSAGGVDRTRAAGDGPPLPIVSRVDNHVDESSDRLFFEPAGAVKPETVQSIAGIRNNTRQTRQMKTHANWP